MHKHLEYISTVAMPRDVWLAHRRQSIGGSDAAAVAGLSDWASPYSVWADKRGLLPAEPENEAMRQGRDFEDYVARRWSAAKGKRVRRRNAIIINPDYPFAHANVDRLVVDEDAGLECKTTSSLNLQRFRNGDYPANYYAQCVHYLAVTGAARWYLAVLVYGRGYFEFVIERSDVEADIAELMKQEAVLWEHVKNGTPPPVDGHDATTDALKTIYAGSDGGAVELFGQEAVLAGYFMDKTIRDEAEQRMETARQTLMSDLGDNELGICGGHKIIWKPQNRQTFDAKRFALDNPTADLSRYYKTSTYRKFEIKEV